MQRLSDRALRSKFEEVAQELANRMKTPKKPLKASFPRGYIRRLNEVDGRWPFLEKDRRRTVACIIQLCDINRWHLNVWQIQLTAGTVWEWHCTLPVIAVIETLLVEYGRQSNWLKKGSSFEMAINELASRGIYQPLLQNKLHELRKYRNEIHLYLKSKVEMHDGLPKRYNEAVRALRALEEALTNHWQAQQ